MKIDIMEASFSVGPSAGDWGWVYADVTVGCPFSPTPHSCDGTLQFSEIIIGRMRFRYFEPEEPELIFGGPYARNEESSRETWCPDCGIKVQMTKCQIQQFLDRAVQWARTRDRSRLPKEGFSNPQVSRRGRQ